MPCKRTAEPRAAEDSPEQSEEKSRFIYLFAAVRRKQYMSLNGLHSETYSWDARTAPPKMAMYMLISRFGSIRDNNMCANFGSDARLMWCS